MGMSEPPFPELLQRYPVFRTSAIDEFQAALADRFGAARAAVDGAAGFVSQARMVQFQDVGLVLGGTDTGVSIDFSESERIQLMLGMTGQSEVTTGSHKLTLDQRQCCIIQPGQTKNCTTKGAHAWLTLRIDPEGVERKLTALLGARPKGKLEFAPTTNLNEPDAQSLLRLVMFFAEQVDSARAALPPLLLRELEQAIIVAFLSASRHSFSSLLERQAETPPDRVRRAEEYIEANWNAPIRIEDLAAVTGGGVRSLYRAFVHARGYSPMHFARLVRLRHAKEMLGSGDPETSVTAVALQCGFENIGHFANHYRKTFGELPSAALARARRIKSGR